MHPLTQVITSAVEEFSANHQSLRQLMVNTLVAIVEGKVGPLLAAEKRRADAFLDFDRLKPVLIGEFKVEHFGGVHPETGEGIEAETMIPWTTIKDILKAAALPLPDRTVPLVGGVSTPLPVESGREVML